MAADGVLQLAGVARPVVGGQGRQQRGRQLGPRPGVRGHRLPEVLGEHADVLAPLAQRRHAQAHDVEPEAQVGAEALGGTSRLQRPVAWPPPAARRCAAARSRRGGAARLPAARAAAWPGRAPTARRSRRGRTCRRALPRTGPRRSTAAPVKAPRTWPKSSASISSSASAAQLTATNGPRRRAGRVDRPGHELLADAALAFDQDRERRGRGPRDGRRAAGPSPRSRRPGRSGGGAVGGGGHAAEHAPGSGPSRSAAEISHHPQSSVEGGVAAGHQASSPISIGAEADRHDADGRRRRRPGRSSAATQHARCARPHRDRRGAHGLRAGAGTGGATARRSWSLMRSSPQPRASRGPPAPAAATAAGAARPRRGRRRKFVYNSRAMLRFLTAGESHGRGLVVIVDGLPAGLPIDLDRLTHALRRRQGGYGRGRRMAIESDTRGRAVRASAAGAPPAPRSRC